MPRPSRLLSVNVGVPQETRWTGPGTTGIDKRPVGGPVAVAPPDARGVGLAGDRAYDVKFHGGPDKAVYAYAREDLDAWAAELDRELACGVFGENLTTVGLAVSSARVGERWRIGGQAVLEVTGPRTPCRTFGAWMGERGWVRRFARRGLPGAYLRVLAAGTIEAGDAVVVEHRPDDAPTVTEVFRTAMNQPA